MGIIGETIELGLSNQIKIRQEKLGAPIPSTDTIIYTNSKTAWLRIASSVDVNNPELAGIGDLGIAAGDQLAKNLVLFGPAINSKGDIPNSIFPKGLGADNAAKSLLGVGGNTAKWGLTPPPGVESVNIKALNRGAIRKGQIKIKAHNPDQFRLLEVLYLRLGFTILVEWGHTIYYDNDGNLQQYNDFSTTPFTQMLEGSDFNTINESLIYERNNKDYNYDGFLGYISNFNWSFNPDGSYDITLDVISRGGLIDSLTTNKTGGKSKSGEAGTSGTIISANLKYFYQRLKTLSGTPNNAVNSYESSPKNSIGFGKVKTFINALNDEASFNFGFPFIKEGEIERLTMSINESAIKTSQGIEPDLYYVSMGLLLRIISKQCLVYSGDETPIVGVNSEYGKHWMLSHPFQQSADPRVCHLSSDTPDIDYPGVDKEGRDMAKRLGMVTAFPPYLLETQTPKLSHVPLFRNFSNPFAGDIMGIMLNMNFVIKTLIDNVDKETGNIGLKDFLTLLLDEVAKSTGSINSFNVSYSEEQNEVIIYDDNTIPGFGADEFKRTPIHVYDLSAKNSSTSTSQGLGSFVTNLNFSSKIFPKMQNAVAIAAQNPSDETVGEKVSSFQRLNRGISDRTARGARPYYDYDPQVQNPTTLQKYKQDIYDLTSYFTRVYNSRIFHESEDKVGDFKATLKTILEHDFAYRSSNGQMASPYFIPVELSLDLDGISGFKLYEKFDITPEYILPTSYPNNLNFIIQGVSHTLNNGNWTTQLQTLSWSAEEVGFVLTGGIFGDATSGASTKKEREDEVETTFEGFADPTLEPTLIVDSKSITANFNVARGTQVTPEQAVQFIHPKARATLKTFLQNLLKDSRLKGAKIVITSSLRTFPQQQDLHTENSKNAKAGRSKHNYGCAFDINIFDQKTGVVVAGKTKVGDKENIKATWTKLGIPEIAEQSGVPSWGGNFSNYFDPVHFGTEVNIDASLEKVKEYAAAEGISYKNVGTEIFDIDIVLA